MCAWKPPFAYGQIVHVQVIKAYPGSLPMKQSLISLLPPGGNAARQSLVRTWHFEGALIRRAGVFSCSVSAIQREPRLIKRPRRRLIENRQF